MVRIRLRRVGGKKQASFRIVAADKESPRDGRFIEILGFYNPRTQPATITLKEDRIYHWINNGAQPSESVAQVFQTTGLMGRYERFKAGEKVETLLAEAEEAAQKRNASSQTRHAAPASGTSKRKAAVRETEAAKAKADAEAAAAAAAEAPAAEAPAETAPAAEAPAEAAAEAPVEEAAAAEAPAAEEAKEDDSDKKEEAPAE